MWKKSVLEGSKDNQSMSLPRRKGPLCAIAENNWQKLFYMCLATVSWSRWLRSLRRGPAAAHLLRLWFRIPPRAWTSVSGGCCVLSDRRLCDRLITRPEVSHRLCCVWTWSWSLESEESLAHYGLSCHNTNSFFFYLSQCFSMCKFKQLCLGNAELHMVIWFFFTTINIFFSLGATTPIGGCILQPSSGL